MSRADDVELWELLEALRNEQQVARRGLQAINTKLDNINRKLDQIMVSQADLDQIAQQIGAAEDSQAAALEVVKTGIAALQQANPQLDLSGLLDEVGVVQQNAQAVGDVASGLNPPPPTP